MNLLPLAIALQGVGFPADVMALQGWLPVDMTGSGAEQRLRRLRRM